MQAHNEQARALDHMETNLVEHGGGRTSVMAFVRQWGPCVLTAIVVPGGIVIALLMLLRRWNQRRQVLQAAARGMELA